ncbi:MAG: phosphohydrolase [Pseudomonadales bacterium]|nr:phosphohydrolase [Pseudomonadales bacterium]
MTEYVKLKPGAVTVGKPLLFSVYDSSGNLLLQQGYVINSHEQLDRLYDRGLFHMSLAQTVSKRSEQPQTDDRRLNPFTELPVLLEDLETLLTHVVGAQEDSARRLRQLASRILRMSHDDPDACLGLVHINTIEPSAYEQTLYHAILGSLIGQHLGWEEERLVSQVMASLTANIALLPYQDKLNRSRNPLTEAQRAVLRKHPDLSSQALLRAGISDPLTLAAVQQHHEHPDGSGYPQGLSGQVIVPEAQILALTERYTAMISQRAYRARMPVNLALRELAHHAANPEIYVAFFAQLTPYPPGVLVELINGEVAVVTHRTRHPHGPRVRAIISSRGSMYHGAFLRESAEPEFAIRELKAMPNQPSLNPLLLWSTV